ncbi:polymorphic toxin-type HINT domain-containing protein [Rhizomonospora bruguierae]|uniref:polymorphic toxin-type HINT domain-containing protein n=1 Tax=Rhizomonospora bruguierae TaxID=1581705 RepID=UPI001BD04CB4|nr:polymorphic toxin-type HINT domain-containing protein [Micromonospora sp. NBRC 107566]
MWDTTRSPAAWQDVKSWTLDHGFPPTGDGSDHPGLWLNSITHAGHVGGTVTMPPVSFTPVSMPNRVLTKTNTSNNWQRIGNIVTETGAKIQVTYSLPECTASNLPTAAHTNTMLCYPVIGPDPYDPDGAEITEWWHKYVVTQVSESDLRVMVDGSDHGAPTKNTSYKYVGDPAWHYADDDGLIKPKRKTWNQFRGYATVETRAGDAPNQTLTVTTFLRGMHGDRAAPSGGTRQVPVAASIGESVNDEDQFAGMIREQVTYDGVTSKPVSKVVNVPWLSPPTASRTINDDTVTARFTDIKVTYQATALGLNGQGGWRTTRTETKFNDTYGTPDWVQDDGDIAKTGDEQCVTYTYNRNTDKNIVATVKRTSTTALTCNKSPASTDDVISDERNYYDGADSPDTVPSVGAVTSVEHLKDWTPAGGTSWQTTSQTTYDTFGRPLTVTDVRGNTTTTTYTPASGVATKVTGSTPDPNGGIAWSSTLDVAPYWDLPVRATDPNNRVTDAEYDPLGRLARVWKVGWDKASNPNSPSVEYSYVYPAGSGYPYIRTRQLNAAGGYLTSYQIFDGFLRPRQTQGSAVGGGRVVTDTIYDNVGRAAAQYAAHVEPGDPVGELWWEPEWSVPALTKTIFDNASRPVSETFYGTDGVSNLIVKWRTTTSYTGDTTTVTPPEGGTPTTTVTDAQDRMVELREFTSDQGVTGPYRATRYSYNRKGQLWRLTDAGGNEWTSTFDVKGRQIEQNDPDTGRTTSEYNDFDELTKTTDANNATLAFQYDKLGRKIGVYDTSISSATKRAEWKYDKLFTGQTFRGKLTETIRYEPAGSANAYRQRVAGFNTRYQPTGVSYVIPTIEGTGPAGTWTYAYSYSTFDGTPTAIGYPAAGGLTAETVTAKYDKVTGLPTSLETNLIGLGTYVSGQTYTAFGEPSITTRQTSGSTYVEDSTEYDLTTRRISRTLVQPETATGTVSDRQYSYLDAGPIRSISDVPQVGSADTQCFRQDTLGRLTSAWTPKAGLNCGTDPSVANLGGPAPYWLDWTVNLVGNHTKEVSRTAAGTTTRDYTHPTSGAGVARPHAVTKVTTTKPDQTSVVTSYDYDTTGNTTCRPTGDTTNTCQHDANSQVLEWNPEGRLATATAAGKPIETNIYDADGTRWLRRDAAGTTLYLPGQEVRREGTSITATRYYNFTGKLIASRNRTGLTWLYTDHQGTQTLSINANSQAVTIRRQTPYGGPRDTPPVPWINTKGFVGGDNDPTGLVQLGARHYDPSLGRFVSVDPLQDPKQPEQWNGYAYASSSPISRSDPSGLMATEGKVGGCVGKCPPPPPAGGGGGTAPAKQESRWDKLEAFIAGAKTGIDRYPHDTAAAIAVAIEDPIGTLKGMSAEAVAWQIKYAPGNPAIGWSCVFSGICSAYEKWQDGDYYGAGIEAGGMLAGALPGIAISIVTAGAGIAATEGITAIRAVTVALRAATGIPERPKLPGIRTKPIPCNSFAAGTEVLLADGTRTPIKDVEVGDIILSTDPTTGETRAERVTHLHLNQDTDLTDLTVQEPTGAKTVIHTTQEHPFWDETAQQWVNANQLPAGHQLHSSDGATTATVLAVTNLTGIQTMYNLTVTNLHTYYVMAGNTPVLVHNCGGEVPAPSMAGKPLGPHRPSGVGDDWIARTADNGKGSVWQAPGSTGNADMVRTMNPTTMYPNGYVRFYNRHGQPIGLNGKPGSKAETHIPMNPDGTYPLPNGW